MPDDAVATESDAPKSAEETLQLWERMKQKEKQRKSVLEGISHAQGALPRAAKVVSRVAKSANRTQLEQAYTAESQSSDTGHDHQYADRIIAILRDAQRNGVDVESELRCRLRDLECAIERIESENR